VARRDVVFARKGQIDTSIYLKDYGAVGDGLVDDSAALNSALENGGYVYGDLGKTYLCTSPVIIPSNTTLDLRGATIKRGFVDQWLIQNTTAKTTHNNVNITLKNFRLTDDGTANSRGNFILMSGVTNLRIENYTLLATAPYAASPGYGAWSSYITGEDITITGVEVDSTASGLYADGMHFGYVKNLSFTNFNIKAGDDGIAFHFVPSNWAIRGTDGVSENINVSGGTISSEDANGVRIGGWGTVTSSTASGSNSVWKNISISDITFGPCGGRCIKLEDTRSTSEINGKHNNVFLSNLRLNEQSSVRLIDIIGNPNIATSGNYTTHNYGRVIFDGVSGVQTSAALLYCGGVDTLEMRDINLTSALAGSDANVAIQFKQIDNLNLYDFYAKIDGSGTNFSLTQVVDTRLYNPVLIGNSGFQLIALVKNSTFGVSLRIYSGEVRDSDRLIQTSGTGTVDNFIVSGTNLSNEGIHKTNITTAGTSFTYAPLHVLATSDGTTGGTSSAGAGNQYVELEINGTTYKVLHDGTV
jgi:hypothetical protein